MINFTGQIALITGGSRGIGAATALLFAEAGANVAILYRTKRKAAERVLHQIEKMNKAGIVIQCNVESFVSCARAVRKIMQKFGRIDILVNSAGIWERGSLIAISPKQWERTISINLTGTFNMCKAVVPIMKKQHYGRIINVSSTAGQRGEANYSHYASSKGGILAFTKSIAVELIREGIGVNCVAPGWVETDMTAKEFNDPTLRKNILKTIPRQKVATPEEIAGPIVFLASNLANNIVGEILNVNGGSVLCG